MMMKTKKQKQYNYFETSDFKIGLLVDEIFGIVEIPEDLVSENSHNQPKQVHPK